MQFSKGKRPENCKGVVATTKHSAFPERGEKRMLRITVEENNSEQKWVLQGRLTANSASELISNWKAMGDHPATRLVDLTQVISIDKAGENVLSMMIHDGAKFITAGLYTTYLLEALGRETDNT
jgi:ABC-type transporter Mla MlaB component